MSVNLKFLQVCPHAANKLCQAAVPPLWPLPAAALRCPAPLPLSCRPYLSKVFGDFAPQYISLLFVSEVVQDVQEPFLVTRGAVG
jgi:hypothetical protein